MLSQYSWWDFFKVVGTSLVIYYAYVAWAYYREDIREWFSSRGQPAPATTTLATEEDEAEPDPGSIFMVKDYSAQNRQRSTPPAPVPAPPIPTPSEPAQAVAESTNPQQKPTPQQTVENKAIDEEVDLAGPVVSDQSATVFGFPVADEPESLSEQSVDDIISAAGRIEADEQGVFSPVDDDDQPASTVSAIINNQQGRSVFADFRFTR